MLRHLALALLCFSGTASAQNLDSLRGVWMDPQLPDSARFRACYDLAWEGFLFNDPDSAMALANVLQQQARAAKSSRYDALAYDLHAAAWYVKGDMRKALSFYAISLPMHERSNDAGNVANVIGNMGSMYSFFGEHEKALELYGRGLILHTRLADTAGMANDINAMGRVHMVRSDHKRAMDHYTRSLRMQHALKDDRGIATGLANLGSVYILQNDFRSALPKLQEALRISEKLDDKHQAGETLMEIGTCHKELGDTAQAMACFRKSMALREELDDAHGIVSCLNKMGEALREQQRPQDALALYTRAIGAAEKNELPFGHATALIGAAHCERSLGHTRSALSFAVSAARVAKEAEDVSVERDAAEVLYLVHRELGNATAALAAHETYMVLRDSMMREENQRAVLRNEYRYLYEQQAITDSLQHALQVEQEALQNEQRFSRERTRLNIAVALGILAAIILLVFWQRARLLRRTNAAILDAQTKLVESEKRREAEEVRTHIARDVHDQLGSDLTKLVMLSSEAKAQATADPGSLAATADDIERVASEANRSLGDIVWAIDPHHDSLAGLTERVRAHCERMLKWSNVEHTVDCTHDGPDRTLDPATKRDIYLMLREALNNAIKYAKAKHIGVRFHTSANAVVFEVNDDGVGIDLGRTQGHGLKNMQQRAERINATLTVESAPMKGTHIRSRMTLGPE